MVHLTYLRLDILPLSFSPRWPLRQGHSTVSPHIILIRWTLCELPLKFTAHKQFIDNDL
jgi:hypothetical protein